MHDRDDAEPSYDPRSWRSARPALAPPPEPPAPARRAPGPATLAAALIAAAGAAFAYAARPDAATPVRETPPPPARTAADPTDQRVLNIASPAAIASTLRSLGIAAADAGRAGELAGETLGTAPGLLRLEVALSGDRLHALTATHADGAGVTIERSGDGLAATAVSAKLTRRLRFVRGELDGESFYSSAVAAGVNDALVGPFANAFRYDFDIQREVSAGDVFEAGFEERVNGDGEAVGTPRLVYAFLSTPTKTRALYQFRLPGEREAEWFDSSGRSSRRSLMRTPVDAARISSGFGMRGHPILGFRKMHRGTDFAAPTGTPIFAAGDAAVSFAGMKGANGNFVRLRHDNGWETLYLHMNRIAPGIVAGGRVAQGTQIGEVGTTGRSTGPHLHYEVHVDGQAVDPLSIETGGGRTIPAAAMAAFRKVRDAVDARRAAAI